MVGLLRTKLLIVVKLLRISSLNLRYHMFYYVLVASIYQVIFFMVSFV